MQRICGVLRKNDQCPAEAFNEKGIYMNSNLSEDDARKEIETCLNKNMFVEAGAGAGKTRLIVKRIINMLKNNYAPGEIVVITFTNAAAEELRTRLSKEIRENGLNDALKHFDEMNISTIHSFCNRLLHEKSIEAGLPIDIKLISEGEDSYLKNKALNQYLRSLDSKEWDRLERYYPENKTRAQIRSHIQGIYLGLLKYSDDINPVLPSQADISAAEALLDKYYFRTDDKEYEDRLKAVALKILELAATITNQIKNYSQYLQSKLCLKDGKTIADKIQNHLNVNCDLYLIDLAIKGKSRLFGKSGLPVAYKAGNVDSANEAWQNYLRELYGDCLNAAFMKGAKDSGELLKNLWFTYLTEHALNAAKLYRSKRPAGLISNDRLLFETKKLISDTEGNGILSFFASKYRTYFVDEFQDTDSVQADFIYRLASDPEDLLHERLRDGSLFLVGDPKQSIYRFRGAEPEVFFAVKKKMNDLRNASIYELHNNYRTNEKLLNWINSKFPEFAPMTAVKKAAPDDPMLISGAYRYLNPEDYSGEYSADKDAEDVATLTDNLIRGGYKITDYRENGEVFTRSIKPSDILIITHKKKTMAPYLDALKSKGIAVYFDGETDLQSDPVLSVFVRVFRYLVNPKEAFYRVAAEEAIRETCIADNERDIDRYRDAVLDILRKKTRGMTAFGKAEFLKGQLSLLLKKNTVFSFGDLNTSFGHINQMLEYLFENVTGTGSSMIESMDEYVGKKLDHELSLTKNPDAVRFMNLHKTKGLEGRIVIIADREKLKWSDKISDIKKGDDYYPGYSGYDPSNSYYSREYWSSAIGRDDVKDKYIDDSKAEFHRFEYVAVTRAEQAVIFMNKINGECIFSTEDFNFKLEELPSVKDIIEKDVISVTGEVIFDRHDPESDPVFSAVKENDSRIKAIYEKNSPSHMELPKEKCVIRKEASGKTGAAVSDEQSDHTSVMKRPVGMLPGNVLHRTLELLVERYNPNLTADGVTAMVGICTSQALTDYREDIDKEETFTEEELRVFIESCAKAYFYWAEDNKILENAMEVHTELPFSYFEEREREEATGEKYLEFMKGNADLIIRYDDRVLLIDYKSDNDILIAEEYMPEVLKEKYSPQLKLYRHMIEKLFKVSEDKISLGIISFSLQDTDGEYLPGGDVRVRYTEV